MILTLVLFSFTLGSWVLAAPVTPEEAAAAIQQAQYHAQQAQVHGAHSDAHGNVAVNAYNTMGGSLSLQPEPNTHGATLSAQETQAHTLAAGEHTRAATMHNAAGQAYVNFAMGTGRAPTAEELQAVQGQSRTAAESSRTANGSNRGALGGRQ